MAMPCTALPGTGKAGKRSSIAERYLSAVRGGSASAKTSVLDSQWVAGTSDDEPASRRSSYSSGIGSGDSLCETLPRRTPSARSRKSPDKDEGRAKKASATLPDWVSASPAPAGVSSFRSTPTRHGPSHASHGRPVPRPPQDSPNSAPRFSQTGGYCYPQPRPGRLRDSCGRSPERRSRSSPSGQGVAGPTVPMARIAATTAAAASTATATSPTPRRAWRSCDRDAEGKRLAAGDKGAAVPPRSYFLPQPTAAPTTPKWSILPRQTEKSKGPSSTALPASDTPSRLYGLPSWYKQNRELKRRSTAIMQKVIQVQPDGALLDLLADETDAAQAAKDEDDLEDLRNTVKRLSGEVARLQSELNSARLQEFEAQEAAVTASAELDETRRTQAELAELRALRDNMAAAASLVQKEVAGLRQQCEQERQTARRMRSEADKAVKERNVMAHQSSLLAEALSQDDRLLPILAEVENLKRLLEEERCRVRELQWPRDGEDAANGDHQDEVEILDERLKIAEEELRHAAARADRAERDSSELRERLLQIETELEQKSAAPPPPPPMAPPMPPPPPPPPLPALALAGGGGGGGGGVRLRTRGGSGASSATGSSEDLVNAERNATAVQDMANLLGIPRKPQVPEAIPGGAIDNIINQIKGGRFTLKATEQNLQKEKKEEPPPAVTEMLNILGTLRRRPRAAAVNAPVPTEAPRDVAL